MLRALSLCACCRHYPGAAAGRRRRSSHPAVTAFPDNVVGSACTSSFSRPARRSLALRPAHSRGHLYVTSYTEGFSHFVTSMTARLLRLERLPGGACTHWKAPPCHGAHVKRSLATATVAGAGDDQTGVYRAGRSPGAAARLIARRSPPTANMTRQRGAPGVLCALCSRPALLQQRAVDLVVATKAGHAAELVD